MTELTVAEIIERANRLYPIESGMQASLDNASAVITWEALGAYDSDLVTAVRAMFNTLNTRHPKPSISAEAVRYSMANRRGERRLQDVDGNVVFFYEANDIKLDEAGENVKISYVPQNILNVEISDQGETKIWPCMLSISNSKAMTLTKASLDQQIEGWYERFNAATALGIRGKQFAEFVLIKQDVAAPTSVPEMLM